MLLTQWIDKNGGAGPTSALLGLKRNAIYAWRIGRALPRPEAMAKIYTRTKGRVSYKEMVEEHLDRKAKLATKKKKPGKIIKSPKLSALKKKQHKVLKQAIRKEAAKAKKKRTAKIDPGF